MIKRIIIYCLISFTFISCHNKVKGTGMAEKDSLPVACLSNTISRFELIEPEKTVVEKCSMREDKVVSTRDSCIDVDCLQLDLLSKERCFIKVEIFNNTNDTIFYSNNTFLYYDKDTGSWPFLPFPENFAREDLGIVIAPHIKQHHTFFLPIRDKILQGKYKLQLSFYTNSEKVHYYVSKVFIVK